MTYTVVITRSAQKILAQLPLGMRERVRHALVQLGVVPLPTGCAKLRGREGWRIRVGSYRVIYEIDNAQRRVTILHIGQRRDIYR